MPTRNMANRNDGHLPAPCNAFSVFMFGNATKKL